MRLVLSLAAGRLPIVLVRTQSSRRLSLARGGGPERSLHAERLKDTESVLEEVGWNYELVDP